MSIIIRNDLVNFNVMHLANDLDSKDLNEFLDMKEELIMKSGLPPKINKFLESTYQIIGKNGPEVPSSLAKIMLDELSNFNDSLFWTSSEPHIEETCHFFIGSFLSLGGESVIPILQPFNFECLCQIHQKILTCIANKITRDLGIQDHKFVIVPGKDSISTGHAFFKRHETWFVEPFSYSQGKAIEPINMTQLLLKPLVDHTNGFQKKFIPLLGQTMFVENDLSLVTEKSVLIDLTINPWDPKSKKFTPQANDTSPLSNADLPSLIVTITYFIGLPEYDTLKPNCITFEMIIDSRTYEPILKLRVASPNMHLVSMLGIESEVIGSLEMKAAELVEDFKQEWVQQFFSPENRDQYFISYPKTDLEKKKALVEILLGLSVETEKNADLIEYLFLELEPTLTIEEFKDSATSEEIAKLEKDELEPSPQLMSKVLVKDAMNEYKAAKQVAPPESNNNVIASTPVPTIKDEVLQKDKITQAKFLSKVEKKEKKFSKKEKKHPATKTVLPPTTAPAKQFKLDPEEKEKVKSVMQGNPMRSKDFNKFFTKLLKRKMGEDKQTVKKGSHIKLHIEKTDGGSTGHTLVRIHGKKDTVGFIGSQKRSLKDLFGS